MASKFFRGFNKVFSGPKEEKFGTTKYATIGGVKPKLGGTRKSDQIKRSNKILRKLDKTMKKDMSPKMRERGEKLKKEVKETQKKVYRSKFVMGGVTSAIDKLKRKGKSEPKKDSIKEKILPKKKKDRLEELKKELGMKKGGKAKFPDLTGDGKVTRADILKGRGVFKAGGVISTPSGRRKREKELNVPLKKLYGKVADRSMKRLKKRGDIKIKDLEGKMKRDITEAGKAMGGYKRGGGVKQAIKTITSPITRLRNKMSKRKFGRGKK